MAVSAQLAISNAYNVKSLIVEVPMAVVSGAGTAEVVTLDAAFLNDPKMLVVPPAGAAGTYTNVYASGGPTITVDCTGETALDDQTVRCILVAFDQP